MLASLARQTTPAELVVVDDGSSDGTQAVIAEATERMPLVALHHPAARGRSAASNAGAQAATGDLLIFLDGDTLAHEDLVARHVAAHRAEHAIVGRGDTFHLRCTRFLRDPETGEPWPESAVRLARLSQAERDAMRVTVDQIACDFPSIARRAEAGIYPGAAPRRLYELEMEALNRHRDCNVLWAAASGSNQSVLRSAFLDAGGFDEGLDLNEHRELALRLCLAGARMAAVPGARSYHLTHTSTWRDPLIDTRWEEIFYRKHPLPAVKLLSVFWAGLAGADRIPEAARIASFPALEAAARGETGIDYDAIRRDILGLRDYGRAQPSPSDGAPRRRAEVS
jgi:glycosyltransferase involved in cell wall biosynthesis